MRIIGANICFRPSGKKLRDAGACLLYDGQLIVGIAEERITRIKHDYTIRNSIEYCLKTKNLAIEDIDYFVFSMCGAPEPSKDYVQSWLLKEGLDIPTCKIVICPSHHLSHAASAFFPSGFNSSLVMVADRDGSILEEISEQTFANSVEHLSYYVGNGNSLELYERDETMFGDIGLGMGYSYVTEWLGYDGHSMAGKTMALAAYGQKFALEPAHIFEFQNNKIHCLLEPIDCEKSLSVRRLFFKQANIDVGRRQNVIDENSQTAFNVASVVQNDLEDVVLKKLAYLKDKTGMTKLCLAGGVALNCRLNYRIYKSGLFDEIFIQPAAGDTGQCLGNALYCYCMLQNNKSIFRMKNAYFGVLYQDELILNVIEKYKANIEIIRSDIDYRYIAEQLYQGKIVGWFQGKSEFGPRALGNRSILASPMKTSIKERLNKYIKFREWYRPFGVCVLEEYTAQYFDYDGVNPYMLIAPDVRIDKKKEIIGAIHVDMSSRIQTVSEETNEKLYRLISEFREVSGVPMLINTSFNTQGEPIVESPEDAIKSFIDSNIDILVLGKNIILKKNDAIKRSLLDSTYNTRDLGGYHSNITCGETKHNRLYRSDELLMPSEKDVSFLIEQGLTTIVDMRGLDVVQEKPTRIREIQDFCYYNIPIEEGSSIPSSCEEVSKGYLSIAESKNIVKVFKTIASAEKGVVFFCSAGKDRTGVISALILKLCGVSDDDIAKDYESSKGCTKSHLIKLQELYPDLDMRIVIPEKKYITEFFNLLNEKYETIENYFLKIGITLEYQEMIRSKIL